MPPVIAPGISASLVSLNANLNLVRNQIVNINNSFNAINRNTNTINNTTNLIYNQDDRDIIRLLNQIVQSTQTIERETTNLQNSLRRNHQSLTSSLSEIDSKVENVDSTISTGFEESHTLINERVMPNITTTRTSIIEFVETSTAEIIAGIAELNGILDGMIAFATASRAIIIAALSAIGTDLVGLDLGIGRILFNITSSRSNINATVRRESSGIKTTINSSKTAVQRSIDQAVTDIKNDNKDYATQLSTQIKNVKKDLCDELKKLPNKVAQEVALEVVGESFLKWDSTSYYYPTLTFLFKETNVTNYPRKSQVKLRLKKTNKEITESDIIELRQACLELINLSYNYGTTRCSYVSLDKRFKTVIFTENKDEGIRLLGDLSPIAGETFDVDNLSFTTDRNRKNTIKRTLPLDKVDVNNVSYTTVVQVVLFKVVLLVNGLKSPIIIYKQEI